MDPLGDRMCQQLAALLADADRSAGDFFEVVTPEPTALNIIASSPERVRTVCRRRAEPYERTRGWSAGVVGAGAFAFAAKL